MTRAESKHRKALATRYPPSEPCSCDVCLAYCRRPGWWTVREATASIDAGYWNRMMLELALESSFGVVAPAFHGCGGNFALQEFAGRGCNFLAARRCELHGTGFQPLECRFCHHDRRGQGPECHAALEREWNTPAGRRAVGRWCRIARLVDEMCVLGFERLMA